MTRFTVNEPGDHGRLFLLSSHRRQLKTEFGWKRDNYFNSLSKDPARLLAHLSAWNPWITQDAFELALPISVAKTATKLSAFGLQFGSFLLNDSVFEPNKKFGNNPGHHQDPNRMDDKNQNETRRKS